MPLLALGTSMLNGPQALDILGAALQVGYRHLDSALLYGNHDIISKAVSQSGLARGEIFITTKVPPSMMGFRKAAAAIQQIRDELPGGYADLCLVHFACVQCEPGPVQKPVWTIVERAGTWRALEEAYRDGICHAIGVSNFMVHHLLELREYAKILPSVNQVELSPLAPLHDLVAFCIEHDIVVQGFGWYRPEVLQHAKIQELSEQHGRPAAQIVTMWFLQQGLVPLYKSSKLDRLIEFATIFSDDWKLSEQALSQIQENVIHEYPWRFYDGANEPAPWTVPAIPIS
eukprot:TRINITY_DN63691_c0_g1_i1.p1 TRINITY_DN63691_c0_g1~~TRINITY_DN63691_c0_g1_i1.p1  ORF type:complete len:313 (+),score=43.10 TRINITY_DN63691_c0_g1_i1:79-939(+)